MAAHIISKGAGRLCRYRRRRQGAFSLKPPVTYTASRILHAEPEFVSKEDIEQLLYQTSSFILYASLSKEPRNNGRRSESSCCWKHRQAVRMNNERPGIMLIPWLVVRDVIVRFCKSRPYNMVFWTTVLLDVSHGRALRCCVTFSMTLSNPSIPYLRDSGWIFTNATGDITERSSTQSIGNDPASIVLQHLVINIFSYYSTHNTIIWTNVGLRKRFLNEKSTTQLFFCTVVQTSFLPLA